MTITILSYTISVRSNITSILLVETKLYLKKKKIHQKSISPRTNFNSNKIDRDKRQWKKRGEEEFRDLKRSGSISVQPAISIGLSSFPRRFPVPQGSSSCCKDIHSTLFGGGQRSTGLYHSLSLFSLPSLISDPIIRCRDVVEAWNYGHWHGTVDSPLGESVAVLRLKRRETSRKKMKLSLREIRNTGIGGFRVLVGDPEERSLTGSNGFE